MNIPVGATLNFIKNPAITVTVHDARRVVYKGNITSLTDVVRQILKLPAKKEIQPTGYFSYNGKPLIDIYNETFPPFEND